MEKPKQTEIFNSLSIDDREKIRDMARFYLKNKPDHKDQTLTDVVIDATIHVLIKKGLL